MEEWHSLWETRIIAMCVFIKQKNQLKAFEFLMATIGNMLHGVTCNCPSWLLSFEVFLLCSPLENFSGCKNWTMYKAILKSSCKWVIWSKHNFDNKGDGNVFCDHITLSRILKKMFTCNWKIWNIWRSENIIQRMWVA